MALDEAPPSLPPLLESGLMTPRTTQEQMLRDQENSARAAAALLSYRNSTSRRGVPQRIPLPPLQSTPSSCGGAALMNTPPSPRHGAGRLSNQNVNIFVNNNAPAAGDMYHQQQHVTMCVDTMENIEETECMLTTANTLPPISPSNLTDGTRSEYNEEYTTDSAANTTFGGGDTHAGDPSSATVTYTSLPALDMMMIGSPLSDYQQQQQQNNGSPPELGHLRGMKKPTPRKKKNKY